MNTNIWTPYGRYTIGYGGSDTINFSKNDVTNVWKTVYKKEVEIKIKKVIFNDPATIVLWTDGTKTVVKCSEMDIFDAEKGLAMAICKKVLGQENYKKAFRKWVSEYDDAKIESFNKPIGIFGELIQQIFSPVKDEERKG